MVIFMLIVLDVDVNIYINIDVGVIFRVWL